MHEEIEKIVAQMFNLLISETIVSFDFLNRKFILKWNINLHATITSRKIIYVYFYV